MSERSKSGFDTKKVSLNIVFSVIAFFLNMIISFFITPEITASLGSDAYGFVKLANDFVGYAALTSVALNSMASRFIMLERERGNLEKANAYYSSVTISNFALASVLLIPMILIVVFLDKLLNVPADLLIAAQVTFSLTFACFLLELAFSTFSSCYFLSNRLDISAMINAGANILRVACVLGLFFLLEPSITYLSIGGLISSVIIVSSAFFFRRKLIPDITFSRKKVQLKTVLEVLSSGIWNAITKLSQIFSSGLDLLMTNLLLGPEKMGYLSVAKTVPNLIATFNGTIAAAFNPDMMMLYAKGDMEHLKNAAKTAMKFMCLFVTIPTAILITMGDAFYGLWVPEQPGAMINVLSVLTVINSCVTGPLQPLYQIFTITNKIKQSSIVMIVYGFASLLVTFVCLKLTGLGLYAVAGVSLVGSLIVALCYHLPFSAVYIGLPWHTFYPEILKSVISLGVQCIPGFLIRLIVPVNASWFFWFGGAILSALIGLSINFFLILRKEERHSLLNAVVGKLKRR